VSARVRSDRLNPVFLKELRQSLRGRTFAILFPATVAIAVALAITVLVDSSGASNLGPQVFLPIFTVLSVAVLGLVPFSTFQSMSGEWDEGTQDLLVLSHLSPMRIVLGKLLTSAIEAGLYVCAFLPLLLFTFLLAGVDVRDVLFLVVTLYAASLGMSCVAMSLAGLSRSRFWRVILLAALAGIGLLAVIAAFSMSEMFVLRGLGLGSTYSSDEVWVALITIVVVGSLTFAFAATRIAHPEDDRSGPVRITLSSLLVAFLAFFYLAPVSIVGTPSILQIVLFMTVLSAIFAVFFVTEPERLPRRTATRIPKNPVLAILAAPFLPGGGRGVLWWFAQLAFLVVWATLMQAGRGPSAGGWAKWDNWGPDGVARFTAFTAYFVVYLAGFSLLMTSLRRRSYGPLAARLTLPSLAMLSMVVPILIGFLVEKRAWQNGEHALLPFWVAFDEAQAATRGWAIVVGALVVLANVPRLVRSVQEVLVASRKRRTSTATRSEVSAHAA